MNWDYLIIIWSLSKISLANIILNIPTIVEIKQYQSKGYKNLRQVEQNILDKMSCVRVPADNNSSIEPRSTNPYFCVCRADWCCQESWICVESCSSIKCKRQPSSHFWQHQSAQHRKKYGPVLLGSMLLLLTSTGIRTHCNILSEILCSICRGFLYLLLWYFLISELVGMLSIILASSFM